MVASNDRSFLLLQGPIGPFFDMLARRLRQRGQAVERILFNGGDRLFHHGSALNYRGGLAQWPEFLDEKLRQLRVTDLVLFGDCRPLHRAAIAVARRRGVTVHVFEEGYFRPNWLTLESGGVNGHSALPRLPRWYLEQAASTPVWQPAVRVTDSFLRRAAYYVLYNFAVLFGALRYPGYTTHRPWHPLAEYASGVARFFLNPFHRLRTAWLAARAITDGRPYYLLPLQLEADSQIRFHFPPGSLVPAIEQVVASFANHAPSDRLLIVTEHPLDSGIVNLARVTREAAQAAGVARRVIFMRGGSSEWLTGHCRGLVTVNSTIGFRALALGVPVRALGWALYDMPGLACQRELDQFWEHASAPDPALFEAFRRVVLARAQINGGLYGSAGLQLAADNAAVKLCASAPVSETVPVVNAAA